MAFPDQVHPLIGHAYRLGEVVPVGQHVSLEVSDLADPFLVHQVEASTGSMWLPHKSLLYPMRRH